MIATKVCPAWHRWRQPPLPTGLNGKTKTRQKSYTKHPPLTPFRFAPLACRDQPPASEGNRIKLPKSGITRNTTTQSHPPHHEQSFNRKLLLVNISRHSLHLATRLAGSAWRDKDENFDPPCYTLQCVLPLALDFDGW